VQAADTQLGMMANFRPPSPLQADERRWPYDNDDDNATSSTDDAAKNDSSKRQHKRANEKYGVVAHDGT
jgi:hypothetical protein